MACRVEILSNAGIEPYANFIFILAACTSTSSVYIPSPLLYVEIDRASRVFTTVILAHSGCIVMLSSAWCFCIYSNT